MIQGTSHRRDADALSLGSIPKLAIGKQDLLVGTLYYRRFVLAMTFYLYAFSRASADASIAVAMGRTVHLPGAAHFRSKKVTLQA